MSAVPFIDAASVEGLFGWNDAIAAIEAGKSEKGIYTLTAPDDDEKGRQSGAGGAASLEVRSIVGRGRQTLAIKQAGP